MQTATFPLLSAQWTPGGDDPLEPLLRRMDVLGADDRIVGVTKAGEGNMNLTLRVTTRLTSLIVKQARPWVEKYPSIAAPVERTGVEHAFYRAVSQIGPVARMMPRVLGFDGTLHVLVLEDLGSLADLTAVYRGVRLPEEALADLAGYLAALHAGSRRSCKDFPANAAMRRLNHEHIFVVPLDPGNGLDLDRHEPGLRAASGPVVNDPLVRASFAELGERYLSPGRSLIHGDFFPGSWVESARGVRVIDPEFAFAGDPEFDIGVALAHLRMADESGASARAWLHEAVEAVHGLGTIEDLNPRLVVRYAAVEIIRRIIGVAQLPIPAARGDQRRRAALLEVARRALHNSEESSLA